MKSNKFIGLILALAGLFCIIFPIATSISVEIIVGACFFVGAIFTLFQAPRQKGGWDKAIYLAIAILYAIGGFIMLAYPVQGTFMLTMVIGAIFLTQGIFTLFYWAAKKKRNTNTSMTLLNGIVNILLGAIILLNINAGLAFIGLLVGINLLFTGITILMQPSLSKEEI